MVPSSKATYNIWRVMLQAKVVKDADENKVVYYMIVRKGKWCSIMVYLE